MKNISEKKLKSDHIFHIPEMHFIFCPKCDKRILIKMNGCIQIVPETCVNCKSQLPIQAEMYLVDLSFIKLDFKNAKVGK